MNQTQEKPYVQPEVFIKISTAGPLRLSLLMPSRQSTSKTDTAGTMHGGVRTLAGEIRVCAAAGLSTRQTKALLNCSDRHIRAVRERLGRRSKAKSIEQVVQRQAEAIAALRVMLAELRAKVDNHFEGR